MRLSFSACKQAQPLVNFTGGLRMEPILPWRRKDKVVIVMGATGTGKSRLSIDLATRFPAEIVNSDKMQVYKGLDIVTNKVSEEECYGIPHHLLGIIDPDEDFKASDFRHRASVAVESIARRGRLPIIAGGSNSHIKALVLDDELEFQSKYECCFLWVDVSMPVLHSFVSDRVDRMVDAGLVDEARNFFNPKGDYTLGIRRAIGVPEMDEFFRKESIVDDETKARLLVAAIDQIKANTCKLASCQRQKILSLQHQLDWKMLHLDATEVFLKHRTDADEAWKRLVVGPSVMILNRFLYEDDLVSAIATPPPSPPVIATASHAIVVTSASRC